MRTESSQSHASQWFDRALRDVQRLHRELTSAKTEASQGGAAGGTLASEGWPEKVRDSLAVLQRAVELCTVRRPLSGWTPLVEIVDVGSDIEVSFDLPGVPHASIRVRFDQGVLAVEGERPGPSGDEEQPFVSEKMHGAFHRTIVLPCGVDAEGATATYRDGCLRVRLPKQCARVPDA